MTGFFYTGLYGNRFEICVPGIRVLPSCRWFRFLFCLFLESFITDTDASCSDSFNCVCWNVRQCLGSHDLIRSCADPDEDMYMCNNCVSNGVTLK